MRLSQLGLACLVRERLLTLGNSQLEPLKNITTSEMKKTPSLDTNNVLSILQQGEARLLPLLSPRHNADVFHWDSSDFVHYITVKPKTYTETTLA